jgi:hypothetical protein
MDSKKELENILINPVLRIMFKIKKKRRVIVVKTYHIYSLL